MRTLITVLSLVGTLVLVSMSASAQPAGSAAPGSAATDPAATGSAGSAASAPAADPGSGSAAPSSPTAPTAAMPAVPSAEQLRETCAAAMNADPTFADSIVRSINEDTYKQHARAANAIAKNERHVILAYAAMWILAALFVIFLWRRQQHLKGEIAQLRRDLDAAAK